MRARARDLAALVLLAMFACACGSRSALELPKPLAPDRRDAGPSTMLDAASSGADASWMDAAVLDAGDEPTDAALDGGPGDAGASDAGLGDAGRDGSTPDGSTPADAGADASFALDAAAPADSGIDASIAPDAGPCSAEQTWCADRCVALSDDAMNCGACGRVCGPGRICVAGECACSAGMLACGSSCIDSSSDPLHCGGCGRRCPATAACAEGTCLCPGGLLACEGRCVDPRTDPLSCGACGHTCGVRCDDGTCVDAVDVSVGGDHVCAVTSDGNVWCWGASSSGAAGVVEPELWRPRRVAGIDRALSVAAADRFTCALRDDGSVWCWGAGPGLGTGDVNARSATPVRVAALERVVEIATGSYFACARTDDGAVYCWGRSYLGIFGDGGGSTPSAVPRRIPGLPRIVGLGSGGDHACALDELGDVWCWGSNQHGQLARGHTSGAELPARVEGLPAMAQVDSGYWHVCALSREGRALCWGAASYGGLGDGTTTVSWANATTPQAVRRGRSDYESIVAGEFATCAVTRAGEPWCWGANEWSRVADGTNQNRGDPVRPLAISEIAQISTYGPHTCFLGRSGALWCSGWNLHGEVGDGTDTPRFRPTPVAW